MYLKDTDGKWFNFNPETWDEIGETGTGGLGHFSEQGERTLYASPRKTKNGVHRFVLSGTGYFSDPTVCESGGWSWGHKSFAIDLEAALEIMSDCYREDYIRRDFDPTFFDGAEVTHTRPRGDISADLIDEYPTAVRVRYYRHPDLGTRKTVEIDVSA